MKPSDLYLGVIHFFSILLPGSVLVMLFLWSGQLDLLMQELGFSEDVERYAAFLLAAYGLGHVTFLLASCLDWLVYDWMRQLIWPDRPGNAYTRASALREADLTPHFEDAEAMNTFTWTKARLLHGWPAAAAHVQRFEADSKFFRSLCVVTTLAAIQFSIHNRQSLGYAALAIAVLSLLRYAEQRYKSTKWAYQYMLILHINGRPPEASDKD